MASLRLICRVRGRDYCTTSIGGHAEVGNRPHPGHTSYCTLPLSTATATATATGTGPYGHGFPTGPVGLAFPESAAT
ncbi:uncharacterized protein BP5553_10001 [Venustampulla echinocandica]|uniref:Uncharacterized protein n=1 Tax=Venustampulla echinocandica TaxID=2656787 RepID=A0A370TA16_9HELO|nr:uncharacterized protein BP5553_10001 [Venustampulla echinocandica]RDL30656.1 hypothetical protein BP5553_10001 [Venustampulla echinocandica]